MTISAVDDLTSVTQMQFSNDGINWSAPEPYATTKEWTLEEGEGVKTVFIKLCDTQGNWSNSYVYGVGYNESGQLGIGECMETTPVQTWNISDVKAISAGQHHTVALKEDGTVWAWGGNYYGHLGDNTTTDRNTPVQVKGEGGVGNLEGVKAISAGYGHTVALKEDGTVWAWGYNYYGQLGDNTYTERKTPVQVKGLGGAGNLENVVDISAGYNHTMFTTGARGAIVLTAPKDITPPTAPTIQFTLPAGYISDSWTNQDVTFTITDGTDETGVSRSEYRASLNGGAWNGWTTYSAPVTIADAGTTLVEARTVDNAENISEVATATIKIDKTVPTGSIVINNGDAYTSELTVTLNLIRY